MFKFCPSCASPKISFQQGKVFRCPECGFVYYHNTAAATACLIRVPSDKGPREDRFVFLVRGKEPGAGKLDLPGGFVDPGEGVFEGLYRELREEIGWVPPLSGNIGLAEVFKLYASFSNVYPYKGIPYNTCDLYFTLTAPGLRLEALCPEQAEIAEIRFLKPDEIDYSEFAFESTRRAVKVYFERCL
jgi:ADP-ribose pyrophosphatase YjhB (NUDIX family)